MYLDDMLGNARVITASAGAVCYDADFYPFDGEPGAPEFRF